MDLDLLFPDVGRPRVQSFCERIIGESGLHHMKNSRHKNKSHKGDGVQLYSC